MCQDSRHGRNAGRVQAQDCRYHCSDSSTSLRSKKPRLFLHLPSWAPLPYQLNNSNISGSWHKCLQTLKTFYVKDSSVTNKKAASESKKQDSLSGTQEVWSTKRSMIQQKEQSSPQPSAAAVWTFLTKRTLLSSSPSSSAFGLVLLFASSSLLAPIGFPWSSRDLARDASAERHGHPQCLSLTLRSMWLFWRQRR